jgi:acetyltransferase-like isoleucine patch superfamily enzyme
VAPDRVSGFGRAAIAVASAMQRRIHRFGALGEGSIIRPPYTIVSAERIFIGARTTIGPSSLLSVVTEHKGERYTPLLRIGDDCSIGQNFVVGCIYEITIGNNVLVSSNVFIGDTIHGYRDVTRPVIDQPLEKRGAVHVDDGAFIGINAVILPGVRIGQNAVVGAGSVVTATVPSFTVVAGNPAVIIRRYDPATREWIRERGNSAASSEAA